MLKGHLEHYSGTLTSFRFQTGTKSEHKPTFPVMVFNLKGFRWEGTGRNNSVLLIFDQREMVPKKVDLKVRFMIWVLEVMEINPLSTSGMEGANQSTARESGKSVR